MKQRSDADRRVRQSERLSRVLRVLRCIMGSGRWDAEALARELEVSPRTIHRIMQVLTMADIPWYYCKEGECYRIRAGFKFPCLEASNCPQADPVAILAAAKQVQDDGQKFLKSLHDFCQVLEGKKAGSTDKK